MEPQPKRLSPSCQQVIYEDLSNLSTAKVVIRACMADPDLAPTVTNHRCNGVTLTPSGLYCDMAMTVASYIWREVNGKGAELPGINVCNLEVHKPLIIKSVVTMQDYWLEMNANISLTGGDEGADMSSSDAASHLFNAEIKCTFSSITSTGIKLQECGHCTVRYESTAAWFESWRAITPAITSRIQQLDIAALKQSSSTSPSRDVRLVQRATAYELFQSFVDYTGAYQNMSSVTFHARDLEATSVLSFLPDPRSFTGPYYLDGSCHLSGFLCNAVEPDRAKNAFISNGVAAVRISSHFDPTRQKGANGSSSSIRNYVRMYHPSAAAAAEATKDGSKVDRTVLQGNVYILQDGEIVGVWEGVRFKKIPRRVLDVFLPPPTKKKV